MNHQKLDQLVVAPTETARLKAVPFPPADTWCAPVNLATMFLLPEAVPIFNRQ